MPQHRLPNTGQHWPRLAPTGPDRTVDPTPPRSGDVVRVGSDASIQFTQRPFDFRVIRIHEWSTYDGWAWIDGYQLDAAGEAVERRTIFVQVAGLLPGRVEFRRPQPRPQPRPRPKPAPHVTAAQRRPAR